MSLRTRIALTFLLLLAAVLAAALASVKIANSGNELRAVKQQLENNRLLLRSAAGAVAHDDSFKDAVAARDTDTLVSTLDDSNKRINAALAIVTTLDGHVIAASGLRAAPGSTFPIDALQQSTGEGAPNVMVSNDALYQLIAVQLKMPQPVAWIVMGFELDKNAQRGLDNIDGLGVSVLRRRGAGWQQEVMKGGGWTPSKARQGRSDAEALAQSLADARAPFEGLTNELIVIAVISLIGFAGAAFWIARTITRPLADLTRSVGKVRDGTYDVPAGVARSDEIGVLAEGLQLMSQAVMSRDQSIRRLAYQDALTGLMNRTGFSDRLGETLQRAAGAPIAVAIINLHRFRRINEHLGFSVGDAVLTTTAKRLAAVPSVNAAVARLAADEFAAFTVLTDDADPQAWGASLLVALSEPVFVEAQPVDISVTVGLAIRADEAHTPADLLRRADLALERARREKRPLAVYDSESNPSARDQLSLLGELRRAIEYNEFRLFFQPQIEMATGRVSGAEVLIRWQHPTRGMQSPAAFIPFAEQTGFIRRLTRWTLDRAIAQGALWYRTGRPLPLSVNISAEDLADARLVARVAGFLSRHQLPPSLLTLEVTESGFIENPATALSMLNALAGLEVGISIDDFGTGYSSLSHLARMPADEVKIDRSFIQGLEAEAEYAAVVRSAIEMGHSLGLKVVAEGIETESAAERLRSFGCDIAQGYLYAKPMPLDMFTEWLAKRVIVPIVAIPMTINADDVSDTLTLTY
jgi:diguanylate cyclase (GGDEF)-like protein